jgi:catechol 2,3-dioxygenase-like lactoylglutathione lyase family enzyme
MPNRTKFCVVLTLLIGLPSGWSQDGSQSSAQVNDKHGEAEMKSGGVRAGYRREVSKKVSSMITYREPMINYYVRDPERVAAFYQENFGFVERFRTPETGPAIHIEVALGTFAVGFARIDAVRSMHHLDLDPGKPRGEIAIWTDNVDAAIAVLRSHGIRVLSEPHNFLVDPPLRAAWVEDPEGNPIQIVCKRPDPASATGGRASAPTTLK